MLILPTRRQVLTGIGCASVAGLTGTAAYGVGVEAMNGLVVTRYAPVLPGWTPGLRLKVAVLADFHVCEPFMPLDRVAEMKAQIDRNESDIAGIRRELGRMAPPAAPTQN